MCVCISGKFVENVYVDGNILTSLEQAYSPENVVRNSLANFTDLIHFTEFIQRKQVPCLLCVQFNEIMYLPSF